MSEPLVFQVRINRSAQREMDRLPRRAFERISRAILALERQPRPAGCRKLRGGDGYRVRVGEYRILYSVDDPRRVVLIVAVGHRRDVYRGR